MTVTDDQAEVVPARQAINEMVDAGLLDQWMSKVDGAGLALTGESGLLPELVKAVLERGPPTRRNAAAGEPWVMHGPS